MQPFSSHHHETRKRIPVLALCGLLGSLPADARTWHVTTDGLGDAPAVQAGIDSAAVGDTVLVHSGTYFEAIDFLGKDIVVKSAMGPEATVLDGGGEARYTVQLITFESREALIEGFTITGGQSGMAVRASSPIVRGNVIEGNGDLDGAGIWITRGGADGGPWAPLIEDNVIRRNRSLGGVGGGIGVFKGMTPEIIGNLIEENSTIGDGGGIYWLGRDDGGIIRGNVIRNNTAGDHGGGIHIGSDSASQDLDVEVSGNVVAGNIAEGREDPSHCGGGIRVARFSGRIHHNTVVGNSGVGLEGGLGGALAVNRTGAPLIEMNIFAFTVAGGGVSCTEGASPILLNNLAWQNAGGDGVDDCPDWWQTGGNVVADPQFCGVGAGNYTVSETSPALTHPAGPLGAFVDPGCKGTPVRQTTWGAIKALYGR